LTAVIVTLAVYYTPGQQDQIEESDETEVPLYAKFPSAAIAVDGAPCANVGADVLKDGGNAVDAAIAALFCNGVANSHSMGIGGGFLMTIYNRSEGTASCLNAREKAPLNSSTNMFVGYRNWISSEEGPMSVAVPGEIAGYWEARKKFGNPGISWQRLLQPTIEMCREGILVSATMAETLLGLNYTDPGWRRTFIDPDTGEGWREGQVYTRRDLADTLQMLAEAGDEGDKLFYNGTIGQMLVDDLRDLGGVITMEDMSSYRVEWQEPIRVLLNSTKMTLLSVPPPGSGAVLAAILNIMQNYDGMNQTDLLFYHRLVESYKWAYGARSHLGDPADVQYRDSILQMVREITSQDWAVEKFLAINDTSTVSDPQFYGGNFYNVDDHGTAHLSIVDQDGNAVAVTSTINQVFGSKILSSSTGIIYNDQMDDFSTPDLINGFGVPPSPVNYIKPGKRPMSSMSPSILINEAGEVEMVMGASGGTKITTSTALVTLLSTQMGLDIEQSVNSPRLHHQLSPMVIKYESTLDADIIKGLENIGHATEDNGDAGSVVGAIQRGEDGKLHVKADFRKSGGVAGF